MPKYICQICGVVSEQKSHHDSHLKRAKHKQAVKIFTLELEKLSVDERIEKYGKTDISEIVKDCSTVIEKPKEVAFEKKTISGEVSWSLSSQEDANPEYASTKSKLESVIKRCHQILYSASSTVGSKAQNDIMRLLCLKLLSSQFADQSSGIWEKCDRVKVKYNLSDSKFQQYKNYCIHFNSLASEENITNVWKQLVTKFLIPLFPSIYFEEDSKFNTPDVNAIKDLILAIDELNVDEKFIDTFSTTCGDIHEAFRAYGGRSSGAKELGQYFTPRHLIHLMFHGLGLDSLLDNDQSSTIYDPCMGTGGFLTRLFKMASIPSNSIYGCETEQDTIKFGEMSMLLTTGDVDNHIKKCNSISENEFISQGKRFSAVVTNPPFGTSMKYDQLMKTYETRFPNSDVNFTEVYPLKMNNGAGLFIQHCVHMLADGGVCAIVLPDGELFEGTSGWSKKLRKWLSKQVNIRSILKVPSGTFEHAGVKTNVVVFTKDGPTQNIRFIETTKECNVVKDMFTISAVELKSAGYSLDIGEYLVEETDNYDVPMIALGEVCDIINGSRIVKKNNTEGIYPVFGSGNQSFTTNTYNREGNTTIIGRFALSEKCVRIIKDTKLFLNDSGISINCECPIKHKYISYYLFFNQNIIYNLSRGQAQKNLNMDKFKELKIPLPSLEVQQQIVDELSQIETSIETIESRIAQLKREKDQYKKYGRKAEIRELLKDSEEKMLGEVCEFVSGCAFNVKDFNYNSEGIRVVKVKNIKDDLNRVVFEEKQPYILENEKFNKYKVNNGDIIISIAGSKGIKLGIYDYNTFSYLNQHNCIVKNISDCDEKYIKYYIIDFIISKFSSSSQSSTIPFITLDTLKNKIKIKIPSQEIQQQCITLFEEKEKFIHSIDEKINSEKAYIEELRQMAKDVISSFC